MYGDVWYQTTGVCAPPDYDLFIIIIYEATPDTFGPYFCTYNCHYGYNTGSGEGWYKVIGYHEDESGEKVTEGSTRFYWIGPYERHDFKVHDWAQMEDQ